MTTKSTCPNHTRCNFYKAATKASDETKPILTRYCNNKESLGCFRCLFFDRYGTNLSSSIGPDARLHNNLEHISPSCSRHDAVARIYSR